MNQDEPGVTSAADSPLQLAGYEIRPPRSHELASLLGFFPGNPLGREHVRAIGAFGQPGDIPLGAAIVRASGPQGTIGHFLVYVRPEFRRQKIGTMLVLQVYRLASSNRAEKLIIHRLVHQNDTDNAFYRYCGLTPERELASYSASIERVLAFCQPLVERFQEQLDADRIEILAVETLNLTDVANFFAGQYIHFAEQLLADFAGGKYDLSLTNAAVRQGRIIAAGLGRTREDVKSAMLEIIVVAPEFRRSVVPLAMLASAARLALARKLTHCVFEADERYDHFAVGFARRCGAKPQWKRYRYAINRDQMQAWMEKLNH